MALPTFACLCPLSLGRVPGAAPSKRTVMTLSVFAIWFISFVVVECNPAATEKGGGGGGGGHRAERDRAIESSLTRITSRFDSMLNRMEQLENRIQRLHNLVTTRLDGIENTMASSKLRMDIINEEVSRVEENLNRRWKAFESKIETNLNSHDLKYESKLNLLLREGRRYGDSMHNSLSSMDRRVANYVSQANGTLSEMRQLFNASSGRQEQVCQSSTPAPANSSQSSNSLPALAPGSSSTKLINDKVTNMFEVIIESCTRMENLLKDSVEISNSTRLELHDNFRTLILSPSSGVSSIARASGSGSYSSTSSGGSNRPRPSPSHYPPPSSEVTTNMAILEMLASTESMSSTMSRRIADLKTSMDGKFEMVSELLNQFQDSCDRIQLQTPRLEEDIADILERILNLIENRTSSTSLQQIMDKLETMETKCEDVDPLGLGGGGGGGVTDSEDGLGTGSLGGVDTSSILSSGGGSTTSGYDQDLLRSTSHLPEEDKKLLWDRLFPSRNQNRSLPHVPED